MSDKAPLTLAAVRRALRAEANPEIAAHSKGFFRAEPGGYGEGDRFLGIRVPVVRRLARGFRDLSLDRLETLLRSPEHEARLLALILMADRYRRGDEDERRRIYETYLSNTRYINNWDLVDASAHLIVGPQLESRSRRPLDRLSRSESLWERRIAVIATYHFIKNDELEPTLRLAQRLLADEHDLIHKAVGWMLREAGKRRLAALTEFLDRHAVQMPRTMLRYSIEKLPERNRQRYLRQTRPRGCA